MWHIFPLKELKGRLREQVGSCGEEAREHLALGRDAGTAGPGLRASRRDATQNSGRLLPCPPGFLPASVPESRPRQRKYPGRLLPAKRARGSRKRLLAGKRTPTNPGLCLHGQGRGGWPGTQPGALRKSLREKCARLLPARVPQPPPSLRPPQPPAPWRAPSSGLRSPSSQSTPEPLRVPEDQSPWLSPRGLVCGRPRPPRKAAARQPPGAARKAAAAAAARTPGPWSGAAAATPARLLTPGLSAGLPRAAPARTGRGWWGRGGPGRAPPKFCLRRGLGTRRARCMRRLPGCTGARLQHPGEARTRSAEQLGSFWHLHRRLSPITEL